MSEGGKDKTKGPVFNVTVSPEGKKVVGMTLNGKKWILLGSYDDREAFEQGLELHRWGIESIRNTPFNWRSSIEKGEIVPIDKKIIDEKKVVGIYVSENDFDKFVNRGTRPT